MKFRSVVSSLALVTAWAVASPRTVVAQSFFSTDANVVGGLDVNWMVNASHTGFNASPFAQAFDATGYSQPDWISNNASSTNGGLGDDEFFVFQQTFDLTGFDASTASLTFQWGCDDTPVGWPVILPYFTVNGVVTGAGTCGNYTLGNDVTVTGFQAGVNTLDFYVEGDGETDGMILNTVSITATPSTTTPEPATMGLMATGLVGLAGMRRRKKG